MGDPYRKLRQMDFNGGDPMKRPRGIKYIKIIISKPNIIHPISLDTRWGSTMLSLEPSRLGDMKALVQGLELLNRADNAVQVGVGP